MKTILVIDDDPDIRRLVVWKLTQAGFSAVAEGDGEAWPRPAVGPERARQSGPTSYWSTGRCRS